MMQTKGQFRKVLKAEAGLGALLRVGAFLSALWIGIGLVLMFTTYSPSNIAVKSLFIRLLSGSRINDYRPPQSWDILYEGLRSYDPYSYIAVGIFIVISLPFFRILATLVIFLIEKNWKLSATSGIVLTMLVWGYISLI